MAHDDPTNPGVQIRQADDGSFIIDTPGGGGIRFHVSGLGSLEGVKVEWVAAQPRGLFADDPQRKPRATTTLPALMPEPAERSQMAINIPAYKAHPPAPPAGPLLWIRSHRQPNPEHREARPWLVEAEGLRVGLLPGYTYTVGRDDAADIRVVEAASKGDTVSRNHASLGVIGDGLYLIDDNSRNGTYVGNERVHPHRAMVLRKRTDLFFGKFALVVRPAPDDMKLP